MKNFTLLSRSQGQKYIFSNLIKHEKNIFPASVQKSHFLTDNFPTTFYYYYFISERLVRRQNEQLKKSHFNNFVKSAEKSSLLLI